MTDSVARWDRVKQVFQLALERAPEDRTRFLDETCRDDRVLREQVESLLRAHQVAGGFAEQPAIGLFANSSSSSAVNDAPESASGLRPGHFLGPYQVVERIGRGGMGEVYRAHDTRLDRAVAVKVLPTHVAGDPQLMQRFELEAKTLATLSHPHICVVFDVGRQDGVDYFVMEYLEGETLAERLDKGRLPLDQMLRYATEIADALDKAHRRGVVHRDLKPGNIMVTKDGTKLLDFGLAKQRPTDPWSGTNVAVAHSQPLTGQGTLLGTLHYMAPEQAEGKEADARSDIFAFGAVVYEMVTGARAFDGDSAEQVIAAVLGRDTPRLAASRPSISPALERVVQTCLAKDPDDRWQSAGDLSRELRWIAETTVQTRATALDAQQTIQRWRWVGVGVLLGAIVAGLISTISYFRSAAPVLREVRLEIPVPEMLNPFSLAVSPDGHQMAYAARANNGKTALWVRPLDSSDARLLPGTDDAIHPFWSPDSRFIGFSVERKLKKIEATGGSVQTLADDGFFGGTWNREGIIVFGGGGALRRISASGGEPEAVTELDKSLEEVGHGWPRFLPDGRHFLYLALSRKPENRAIYVGSLDSKTRKRLMAAESRAIYAPPGFLFFLRERTLMARSFDAARQEFTGEPFPITEGLAFAPDSGNFAFTASEDGTLAYRMGAEGMQWLWMDRSGKSGGSIRGRQSGFLRLSPDGKRIAFIVFAGAGGNEDLWIHDVERDTRTQLTRDPATDHWPVWSPDGSKLVFDSTRRRGHSLYEIPSNGATPEQLLFEPEPGFGVGALDWSLDGRLLIFSKAQLGTTMASAPGDLWVLPLDGDRKPFPYLTSPFDESEASLSPNGRWLAYTSNESGTYQIFVRPFPDAAEGKWQISAIGGLHPRWRRNGRELFYYEPRGSIVAVEVKTDGNFEVGASTPLFRTRSARFAIPAGSAFQYDVTPDGQHFLVAAAGDALSSVPITVVLNWSSALKR